MCAVVSFRNDTYPVFFPASSKSVTRPNDVDLSALVRVPFSKTVHDGDVRRQVFYANTTQSDLFFCSERSC